MADSSVRQKIVLVTGKGGVGKSTVAASLAFHLSEQGKRVLLCEFNEESYYSRLFGLKIGFEPTLLRPNLWVSAWDGSSSLRDFLLYYVKLEGVVSLFFDNKIMRALVDAAPALKELALLGKLTSGLREVGPAMPYDVIVADTFSTGHFLALLEVPKAMGAIVKFGPMGEQSRDIHRIITDPEFTQIVLVTLAEELPMTEAKELFDDLKKRSLTAVTPVINKFLKIPVPKEELDSLKTSFAPAADFIEYLQVVDRRQTQSLNDMKAFCESVVTLPLCFEPDPSARTKALAPHLDGICNP